MAYISAYDYYENGGASPADLNWGSYQYIPMTEIVANFMAVYVGEGKEINFVKRHDVLFYTKQGIKQFNYNVFNLPKELEVTLGNTAQMVMPPDYVNFIRISLERDGVLYTMVENKQLNYANTYLQDQSAGFIFDVDGNIIEGMSQLDIERIAGNTQKLYPHAGPYYNTYGWCCGNDWYFSRRFGGHFNMDAETANVNPKYRIDKENGLILFSSLIAGEKVVLEYVTDGMENGDESKMCVPKLAEDAIYSYIKWRVLDNKAGTQEYIKKRSRKEYQAARDNAKIALMGINPQSLIMVLRGQQNWIK